MKNRDPLEVHKAWDEDRMIRASEDKADEVARIEAAAKAIHDFIRMNPLLVWATMEYEQANRQIKGVRRALAKAVLAAANPTGRSTPQLMDKLTRENHVLRCAAQSFVESYARFKEALEMTK